MFVFLDTKHLVSINVFISGHQMFGVEICLNLWTLRIWCREKFEFIDTEHSLLRKCLYFWTQNIWCRERFEFLDTKHLVFTNIRISGQQTFHINEFLQKIFSGQKCKHRNKLHAEFACNFSHLRKKMFCKIKC